MTFGGGQLKMEEINLQHRCWIFELYTCPFDGLNDIVYTTNNEEHAYVFVEDKPDWTLLFDSVTRKSYNGHAGIWEDVNL